MKERKIVNNGLTPPKNVIKNIVCAQDGAVPPKSIQKPVNPPKGNK